MIRYEGCFRSGELDCFILEHVKHDRPEVKKIGGYECYLSYQLLICIHILLSIFSYLCRFSKEK